MDCLGGSDEEVEEGEEEVGVYMEGGRRKRLVAIASPRDFDFVSSFKYAWSKWTAYLNRKKEGQAIYSKAIYQSILQRQRSVLKHLCMLPSHCLRRRQAWNKCKSMDVKNKLARAIKLLSLSSRYSISKPRKFRRMRVLSSAFGEWRRCFHEDMQVSIAASKVACPHFTRYTKYAAYLNLKYYCQCSRIIRSKCRLALVFRAFRNCSKYLTVWKNYMLRNKGGDSSNNASNSINSRTYSQYSYNTANSLGLKNSSHKIGQVNRNNYRGEANDGFQSFIDAINRRRAFRTLLHITTYRKFIIQKHKFKLSDCFNKWRLWKNRLDKYDMAMYVSEQSVNNSRFLLLRRFIRKIKTRLLCRADSLLYYRSSANFAVDKSASKLNLDYNKHCSTYATKIALRKLSKYVLHTNSIRETYDKVTSFCDRFLLQSFFRKGRLFIKRRKKIRALEARSKNEDGNDAYFAPPELVCEKHSQHRVFIAFIRFSISMAEVNARNRKLHRFIENNYKLRRYYEVFDNLVKLRNMRYNYFRSLKVAFLFSKNYMKSKLFLILRKRLNQFRIISSTSNNNSSSSNSSSKSNSIGISGFEASSKSDENIFKFSFLSQKGRIISAIYYIGRRRKRSFFIKLRRHCRIGGSSSSLGSQNSNDSDSNSNYNNSSKYNEGTSDVNILSHCLYSSRKQKFMVSLLCWKLYRYRCYLHKWRRHVKKRISDSDLLISLTADYDKNVKRIAIKQCILANSNLNPCEVTSSEFGEGRERMVKESFYYFKEYFNLWRRNVSRIQSLKRRGLNPIPSNDANSVSNDFQKKLSLSKKLLSSISLQMSKSDDQFSNATSSIPASINSSTLLLNSLYSGDKSERRNSSSSSSSSNADIAVGIYSNLFQSKLAAPSSILDFSQLSKSTANAGGWSSDGLNMTGLTEVNSGEVNLAKARPRTLNSGCASLRPEKNSLGLGLEKHRIISTGSNSIGFGFTSLSGDRFNSISSPIYSNYIGSNNPTNLNVDPKAAPSDDSSSSPTGNLVVEAAKDSSADQKKNVNFDRNNHGGSGSDAVSALAVGPITSTKLDLDLKENNKVKLAKEILKFAQEMQTLLDKL